MVIVRAVETVDSTLMTEFSVEFSELPFIWLSVIEDDDDEEDDELLFSIASFSICYCVSISILFESLLLVSADDSTTVTEDEDDDKAIRQF